MWCIFQHNLFCDNCHSHVAMALNLMHYDGSSNWNMVKLCFLMLLHGRYVRWVATSVLGWACAIVNTNGVKDTIIISVQDECFTHKCFPKDKLSDQVGYTPQYRLLLKLYKDGCYNIGQMCEICQYTLIEFDTPACQSDKNGIDYSLSLTLKAVWNCDWF